MSPAEQCVAALVDNGLTVSTARQIAAGDLTVVASLLRTMAHVLDERAADASAVPKEGS